MILLDDPTKFPVDFGEKIVILGGVVEQLRPIVSYQEWLEDEYRWYIELLWESGDTTRVYSSGRGTSWMTEKEYQNSFILS